MNKPFKYLQLHTTDTPKSRDFYKLMFDWSCTVSPTENGEYTELSVNGTPIGGIVRCFSEDYPSQWVPFIEIDDIHALFEKAVQCGARPTTPVTKLPGKGSFAILQDPSTACFALWCPEAKSSDTSNISKASVITITPVNLAFGASPTLPIPRLVQQAANWCWAACAEMVVKFVRELTLEQGEIVNAALNIDKCTNPTFAIDRTVCNLTRDADQITSLYVEQFEILCDHNPGGVGQISKDAVVDSITIKQSPVQVGFRWSGGGGHVVLVYGANTDGTMVYVNDPWRGSSVESAGGEDGYVDFDYLSTAYGLGTWTHTWTNFRKKT